MQALRAMLEEEPADDEFKLKLKKMINIYCPRGQNYTENKGKLMGATEKMATFYLTKFVKF